MDLGNKMPPKKTSVNKTNKAEIAEKVKEIKQRQQNWLRQRDVQLEGKPDFTTITQNRGSFHKSSSSSEVKEPPTREQNPPRTDPYLQSSKSLQSTRGKKRGFNTWLKNRNAHADEESPSIHRDTQLTSLGESYVVSKHRHGDSDYLSTDHGHSEKLNPPPDGYVNTTESSEIPVSRNNLSPKAFDQLADQIVNRVKNELSIKNKPYYANQYTDTSSTVGKSSVMSHSSPDSEVCSVSGSQENSYLDAHFCPQCSQLMIGRHDPMLIIPCGHNVCKSCSEQEDVDLCSVCSCEVNSFTCNIMLKQIISDYKRDRKRQESKKHSGRNTSTSRADEKDYKEEIKTLMMRLDVLETESDSIRDSMNAIRRDIDVEHRQVAGIERQEERVKDDIDQLNAKLNVLSNHKQDYLDKCENLEEKYSKEEDKLNLVKETIRQLNRDVEKIQLLGTGTNSNSHLNER